MSFESEAQMRYANANPKKFGGQAVVDEFNAATKGKKLPKRKAPKQVDRIRHTARPR